MATTVTKSVYYDGNVTETDRAQNRTGAPDYGVYGPDDFKVTAHPSIANAVIVKAGKAHGHGVTDILETDAVVNCTPLSVGQSRWDLIVVRRNWQPSLGGPSTLEALQAGGTATIPPQRKVGPGVEDDQPLFFVKWQGGTSAPVEFVDVRVWTGNGGLYAKSDLVRTYLEKAGTEVNINGAVWACQLGTNDTPSWVKISEPSRVPLYAAGPALLGSPAAGQTFLIQAGSYVGKSDGAGFERLTFPAAFPNGLLSVVLTNGDGWSSGPGVTIAAAGNVTINGTPNFFGQSGYGSKADVVYEVRNADGTAALNRPHRVNYIAYGW